MCKRVFDRDHPAPRVPKQIELLKPQTLSDRLNLITAGTVIAAVPIVIVLIIFQRQLIRGLTAGAVKG